jgi:hypothetical protein
LTRLPSGDRNSAAARTNEPIACDAITRAEIEAATPTTPLHRGGGDE